MDSSGLQSAVGSAIRQRRRLLGLSQEGLAASAGVHRTYVGSVERGERNISLINLARIASALDCQPSELLSDAEGRLSGVEGALCADDSSRGQREEGDVP